MSVAMATFNGERFLEQQLESILSQTRRPDELVVLDDGSTDATIKILQDFAERSPFPVVVRRNKKRLGYRRNFLRAGRYCSSDLIFFSDQDDIWKPRKISSILPCFKDPAVLLTFHNANVFFECDDVASFPLYDPGEQEIYVSSFCPDPFHFSLGFTQAYRRQLHDFDDLWSVSVDPLSDDQPLAHDQWFIFLARTLGKVAFVADLLTHHRQHERNAFGVASPSRISASEAKAPTAQDKRWVLACHTQARIVQDLSTRNLHGREIAKATAERYLMLGDYIQRRQETFLQPTRAARILALFSNIRRGAYHGRDKWRLPKRWLPFDAWYAVRGDLFIQHSTVSTLR